LILHLKRFIFVEKFIEPASGFENSQPNNNSRQQSVEYVLRKNKAAVKIPDTLSLDPFCIEKESNEERPTAASSRYALKSIVHHIGNRASSGHYTTDALRYVGDRIDDGGNAVPTQLDGSGGNAADAIHVEGTSSSPDKQQQCRWVTFDDSNSCLRSLQTILDNESKQRSAYILFYALEDEEKIG